MLMIFALNVDRMHDKDVGHVAPKTRGDSRRTCEQVGAW